LWFRKGGEELENGKMEVKGKIKKPQRHSATAPQRHSATREKRSEK
jgi:hypothetical protein